MAMTIKGKFGGIIVDPPWPHEQFSERKHGSSKTAMVQMSVEAIAALNIRQYANKNTLLGLWGVWPFMDEATDVMRAWGFHQVSACPWVKTYPKSGEATCGIGHWFQSSSEFFKLCRTGKPKRDEEAPRVRGLLVGTECTFYAPIGSIHSNKPIELHEYFERTVNGPFLELFAREERPGWTCCGLETGWKIQPDGIHRIKRW